MSQSQPHSANGHQGRPCQNPNASLQAILRKPTLFPVTPLGNSLERVKGDIFGAVLGCIYIIVLWNLESLPVLPSNALRTERAMGDRLCPSLLVTRAMRLLRLVQGYSLMGTHSFPAD